MVGSGLWGVGAKVATRRKVPHIRSIRDGNGDREARLGSMFHDVVLRMHRRKAQFGEIGHFMHAPPRQHPLALTKPEALANALSTGVMPISRAAHWRQRQRLVKQARQTQSAVEMPTWQSPTISQG